MSKIIENQYGDIYKTPGYMKTAGAIYAGSLVGGLIQVSPILVTPSSIKNMQIKSQNIDNRLLRQAVNDAFNKSKLAENGVEIVEAQTPEVRSSLWKLLKTFVVLIDENNFKSGVRKALFDEIYSEKMAKRLKDTPLSEIYKKMKLATSEKYSRIFENGYNAAFLPKTNKIVVNMELLGASAFHEMGHAINKNQTIFWKALQKVRGPFMIAGGILPTIAIFKRKKVEGEEPKNIVDKTTTFIKNNVGKLTTLAFVPIIAEELMATQRGNKLAKCFLDEKAFKKVKVTNRLGAASYIGTAILAGVGATVGSKVRDKIAKPKRIG